MNRSSVVRLNVPLIVSAVSVMPNPGDNPLAGPFLWSVKMKTSGMYFNSIPFAASIIRFVIVGEVRSAYATPRIFFTLPGSTYCVYKNRKLFKILKLKTLFNFVPAMVSIAF